MPVIYEGIETYVPLYSFWIHLAGMLTRLRIVIRFDSVAYSLLFFGGAIFATFLYYHIITTIFEVKRKRVIWVTTALFFILYFPLRDIGMASIIPPPRFLVAPGTLFRPSIPFLMFKGFVNNFHYAGVVIALCVILRKTYDYFKSLKQNT